MNMNIKTVGDKIHGLSNKLHGLGFWIIIILLIGFTLGVSWSESSLSRRFDDAIKLGGMIHNSKVYDVKERVIQ